MDFLDEDPMDITHDDSLQQLPDDIDYANAKVYSRESKNAPKISDSLAFAIKLAKLAEENRVSRQVQRDLVNLINNDLLKKVCDESKIKDFGGPIPSPDTVGRFLTRINSIEHGLVKFYPVCPQGCQLFDPNDTSSTECGFCGEARYHDDSLKTTAQEMGIVSIGAALSELLLDSDIREMMQYRHEATVNYVPGEYNDIFDGEVYRKVLLQERNLFRSPSDIAVMLYVDGFPAKNNPKSSMAIIHAIIMNFSPAERYQDNRMLTWGICPAPNNTAKNISSFLRVILDELQILSEDGLIVEKDGKVDYRGRVYLMGITGIAEEVIGYKETES